MKHPFGVGVADSLETLWKASMSRRKVQPSSADKTTISDRIVQGINHSVEERSISLW